MIYSVLGGMLNPTHSLTHSLVMFLLFEIYCNLIYYITNCCIGYVRFGTSGSSWLERQFFSCQRSGEKETPREESYQLLTLVSTLLFLAGFDLSFHSKCSIFHSQHVIGEYSLSLYNLLLIL